MEFYNGSNSHIEVLNSKHSSVVVLFESSKPELNEFLRKDAFGYQNLNLGITYLLLDDKNKLLAYVTLGMGSLRIPDMHEFDFHGKKLKEYPKDFPNQFPALLIGKLATNKDDENKGGGGLLLDYALKIAMEEKQKIGCAYVLAHVYPESLDWYKKNGFQTYVKGIASKETIAEWQSTARFAGG